MSFNTTAALCVLNFSIRLFVVFMNLYIRNDIFNIPLEYLREAMANNFRKTIMSFWMCVKMKYGDSVYHPTIDGIKKDFKCGHKIAKQIYQHITTVGNQSLLFTYNSKTNTVIARTWKLNPTVKNKRWMKDGVMKMKYCAKVLKPKYISIRNVIHAMQEALLKVAIDEKQRSDKFLLKSAKYSSCLDRANALNQKKMGRIINAHRTTAGRRLKHMQNEGKIEISRKKLQRVYDLEHEMWIVSDDDVRVHGLDKRHLIIIGKFGYVRDANEYHPIKRTSFNVIINAINRINSGVSSVFSTKHVNNIPHDHAEVFYY